MPPARHAPPRQPRPSTSKIDNGDDCIVVHDYVDGVSSMVGHVQWRNLAGSRTAEILKGWTLSVNDTSSRVAYGRGVRGAGRGRISRPTSVPKPIKDGRFVAAFGIHSRSPRVWTPDEISPRSGSRRSGLGDARAPQSGSRAARERRAIGVSAPAERRAPPVERRRGHPGDGGKASRRGPSALPASATLNSSGAKTSIHREHTRGVEPLAGAPLQISCRDDTARGAPARRDHRCR